MWSAALEAILTTLRYLAPATLLTLFWGQQSFLFKLLKHIDSAFRAIVFSSEEQKQAVLKWIAEAGPVRVEHLDTVWRHGWILCGVLNAALPGACAGHPPTRLSLKHAQAIADHYLGVEPVFSRQELESNDSLSRHQEWKLATYLDRIREALSKITPPVSKPSSQRTSPETTQVTTLDYVARGTGLTAAQINNKMYFKIYPTAQQSLDPGEITILIRGPKDSYGMTVLQPIPGKAQIIRQKLLGLQSKTNYTENVLPITQGATYLRTFGKNDMNKTYYIPKTKYDIEIDVEVGSDHARIGYTVRIEGKYEISITSRGQSIVGSPFKMTASKNIIDILERESFCLEDGEEIDIVDVKTDRKVVLRIVDFVTEKMLLKENGCLEKITDNKAKILMTTDNIENELSRIDSQSCKVSSTTSEEYQSISEKFKIAVDKIIKMNRICKVFNNLTTIKKLELVTKQKSYIQPRRQEDIPDIVNSTLSEVIIKPYILSEKRDKYIIPECISVSLRIEKPISSYEEINENPLTDVNNTNKHIKSTISEHLEEVSPIIELEKDIISEGKITSSNNPFHNDFFEENNRIEKMLRTFVNTEYETNNSQNEEIQDMPIKILIDKENTPSPSGSNPFTNIDYGNEERPKTPVLKILTDEVKNREGSVYLDSKSGLIPEETLSNEFINPFFMHQQMQSNPIADFIIGAPVSLPPILRAPSPDPEMESIMITTKNLYSLEMNENEHKKGKRTLSRFDYSTPLHKNIKKERDISKPDKSMVSSTSHSLESNYTDELNVSTSSDNNLESFDKIETLQSDRNITPRKDTWDSAYVSIDDNASTPDNNNSENNVQTEISSTQNVSHNDGNNGLNIEELSNMGPAEREIWQTCSELNNTPKYSEDMKLHKLDVKRPLFTPIIEETDRSLSSVMKETKGSEIIQKYEIDSVTEAFAELNDLYQGYFSNAENSSTILISDDANKLQNIGIENIKIKNDRVDSASEDLSDMKRRALKLKGTISEVQPKVTESISVSRTLHDAKEDQIDKFDVDNKLEIQFGDEINIVLERKKYWDERIRQIQAKSEETKLQHKKRRTTYKHLKANDSLTKRKGKQIVKHFLGVSEHQQATQNKTVNNESNENVKHTFTSPQISVEEVHGDVKLVEKWKKYWDDKLETERDETDAMCLKTNKNITKPKEYLTPCPVTYGTENITERNKNTNDTKFKSQSLPVKQELPEEVFKAFETSPKRFFGTSRKQILNKIDAFLGKPITVDKSSSDTSNLNYDTGLVSSRISLFHNISQTEELPQKRQKTRSLHNIYHKEDHKESINIEHDRINKSTEMNDAEKPKTIINETGKIKTEIKTKEPIIEDISERQTESILLKDKRARMTKDRTKKSLDDTVCHILEIQTSPIKQNLYVKKAKNEYNKQSQHHEKYKKTLNKTSISKSEMDIFNKTTSDENKLDKYKSCEELPKINVKSFISLYENVSKSVTDLKPIRNVSRTNSISSQRSLLSISSSLGAETHHEASQHSTPSEQSNTSVSISNQPKSDSPQPPPRKKRWLNKKSVSKSNKSTDTEASFDFSEIEMISQQDSGKETTYLSLSDIELEIIENIPQKSLESTPERNVVSADIDYKTRFKRAKEYFQSLEELRDVKKPKKLNECEMLLYNKSTESLENDRPQRRVKKKIKSHTMPSSEISKIWNQIKENQKNEAVEHKYVKISEKFNVDDLFSDVMEGRLSRQGSLRGIPHKKAVLETFRSMENISDGKLSPYEIAVTQLSDFAKENKIKTAQTYLSEYPYLPTTDPSKYHSRLDIKASGLISLKELLSKKRRRNSVPDLRLNPKFTADL